MQLDPDPEEKMYEALAEKLCVDLNIIELVQPYIGEDNGSSKDEWHYGYYFEIPHYDDLDEEVQEEIKEQIEIEKFPFGKTLYVSDGELSGTKADPLGWRADYEAEEYYQKYLLPKERVIEELDSIAKKMKCSDDQIIVKALLFSAFSITESYIRSLTWSKIPSFEDGILDEKLKGVLKKHLSDKLSITPGRQELYKKFTGNKLGDIPHNDPVRNSLAHDIGLGQVIEGKIIVNNRNDEKYEKDIEVIMDDLRQYVSSIN